MEWTIKMIDKLNHSKMGGQISRSKNHPEQDDNDAEKLFQQAKMNYKQNTAIQHETEVVVTPDVNENCIQTRKGTLTTLTDSHGIINRKYRFDYSKTKNWKEGAKVIFTVFKLSEIDEWRVHTVDLENSEEWDIGEPKYNVDLESGVLICERSLLTVIRRAAILKKSGRILTFDTPRIECNYDEVSISFIPKTGDLIEFEAVIEVEDGNNPASSFDRIVKINKINPSNRRLIKGRITFVDIRNRWGIVDKKIYFDFDVCDFGYTPTLNDTVRVCFIDRLGTNEINFELRAITVVHLESFNWFISNSVNNKVSNEDELFKSKNGVQIVSRCDNNAVLPGKDVIFKVSVENGDNVFEQIILDITHMDRRTGNHVKIPEISFPISVPPITGYTFEVKIETRNVGNFVEVIIVHFNDWEMGVLLEVFIDVSESNESNVVRPRRNGDWRASIVNGKTIQGVRPFKIDRFCPVKLKLFPVPSFLYDIVAEDSRALSKTNQIIEKFPSLEVTLSYETYAERFHALLYLEEVERKISLRRKFDRDDVVFEIHNEYLEMKIPGLCESRPSVAYGDKLKAHHDSDSISYEGCIHKIFPNSIWLKFNPQFHSSFYGKTYKVEFVPSRTTMRRLHQAIDTVYKSSHLGEDWLFPSSVKHVKPSRVIITAEIPPNLEDEQELDDNDGQIFENKENQIDALGSRLVKKGLGRGKFLKTLTTNNVMNDPCYFNCDTRLEFPCMNRRKAETDEWLENDKLGILNKKFLKWVNKDLNKYQKDAVRNILKGKGRPLPYIIFGPPGTGKTVTLVETIFQIRDWFTDSKILISTPSNSAANLVCEKLLKYNILIPGDLVRLVGINYARSNGISDELKPYTAVAASGEPTDNSYGSFNDIKTLPRLEIGRHKIIVGTMITIAVLHEFGFPPGHFTHIIVDEAGQASEPEIMIPLAFLHKENGQAILAGDPMQLGPVELSILCRDLDLYRSLLQRFLGRFPYLRDTESFPNTNGYDPKFVTKLLYNYRSLPDILNLYNSLFYNNNLIAKVSLENSPERDIINRFAQELPKRKNGQAPPQVLFVGVKGVEMQDEDSASWYNTREVIAVNMFVGHLLHSKISPDDIGIVTPYRKQCFKLREKLEELEDIFNANMPKIGSVEEFQGQERQVIIVSAVRSNNGAKGRLQSLGMVSSPQRLNVAISRARALLIIIGNPFLLMRDYDWRRLLVYCVQNDSYTGEQLPPLSDEAENLLV